MLNKEKNQNQQQSSLILQKIRKAEFVTTESGITEKLKYNLRLKVNEYFGGKLTTLKNILNKFVQKNKLWMDKIDFIAIRNALALWFGEAIIEGFVVNFVVWTLIGWSFNWATIIGWGFAVKQSLSIYWRLKKNGPITKLSEEPK